MASKSDSVDVARLFTRLQQATEDEDDEAVLDLTKKILDQSRDDPDALHCQVVSLINLSRFDSALELIRSAINKKGKGQSRAYQLEEAYCLYRQEGYQASLSILNTLPQNEVKVLELVAQVSYRQEHYTKALQTYNQLLSEEKNLQERMANYYASLSLCPSLISKGGVAPRVTETMEQCFNLACCCLVSGRGEEAIQLLKRAELLYRESLEEEGLTEEEIIDELLLIEVQKGYCYQVQEQMKEALCSYNAILKLRPEDPMLVAVVSNNILVLNRDKDVFDSKKKIKVLTSVGSSQKLARFQKLKILFNRCMFALQTNQLDQCRELAAELKAAKPNSDLCVLAEIALLCREKKVSGAIEFLENHLKSHPGSGVELYAALSQLQLNQGNIGKACETLQKYPTFAQHVGVASTVAALQAGMGEVGVAMAVLEQSLTYWMGQSQISESDLTNLTKQVAKFQLSHSAPQLATEVLQRTLQRHDNMELKALLISALSRYQPERAEEVSGTLPAFRMPGHLNINSMEQTPVFRHARKTASDKTEVATNAEVKTKEKKKKKRKPRLPKNYDPNVTPDPERWLPLRERSYFRKSRRKGVAPSRGAQGTSTASAGLMSQLDASKPSPAKPGETAADGASSDVASKSASPRAKPQPQASKKKPKKKRGGKW